MCFNGAGKRLAGADGNGLIIVYDFEAGYEVFRSDFQAPILSASLSFAGDRLAICGAKRVQVYHVQTGAPIYDKTSTDRPRAVKLSADGKRLAAGIDGKMQVCCIDDGARYHMFDKVGSPVRTIAIDNEGVILAMGCEDGKLVVYDLRTANDVNSPQWTATHAKKVWVVAVSPDGSYVAAGDYADTVCVYASKTGELVWSKTTWDGKGAPFTWGLSFSGDSSMLAIGRWDAFAYLLEVSSWQIVASVKRGDRVYSVSLDHLGKRMGVGGRDKKAQVYSIDFVAERRGSGLGRLELANTRKRRRHNLDLIFSVQLDCFVNSVALTPDGKILAVGCVDNVVCIYSVNMKLLNHTFAHGGPVHSVIFSPDARHLAVGGEHNSVNVWKVSEDDPPDQVLALPRQGQVTCVAFSSVSLTFVSGGLATIYGRGNHEYEVRFQIKVCRTAYNHTSVARRADSPPCSIILCVCSGSTARPFRSSST